MPGFMPSSGKRAAKEEGEGEGEEQRSFHGTDHRKTHPSVADFLRFASVTRPKPLSNVAVTKPKCRNNVATTESIEGAYPVAPKPL
jgi:hypothetical protein